MDVGWHDACLAHHSRVGSVTCTRCGIRNLQIHNHQFVTELFVRLFSHDRVILADDDQPASSTMYEARSTKRDAGSSRESSLVCVSVSFGHSRLYTL